MTFVVVEMIHGALAFVAAQPKHAAVSRYYVAPVWAPGEEADVEAVTYEWA